MSAKNVIVVAHELIARHGAGAASLVDRRVQENAKLGDREAAIFWRHVSQAVRALFRSRSSSRRSAHPDA